MNKIVDATDIKILGILSTDGRIQNVDLAKAVGIAPSATLNRLRRLEREGLIQSYTAKLNSDALGLGLVTFVALKTNGKSTAKIIGVELSKIPSILEVHQIAGENCFLIKLRTRDTKDLAHLLNESISRIVGIESTSTTIVLDTYKESISPYLRNISRVATK